MVRKKLSAEALALIYLREARRWTQKELAAAKRISDYRPISRYESGVNPLSRRELDEMASLMGFSRETVDAILFFNTLVSPSSPPESRFPVELTPEELQRIDRAVIADGWSRAAELRSRLVEAKRQRKVETARKEAGEIWARLKKLPPSIRRELVEDAPELQSWAVVQRLCEESEKAAARDPREAFHLADLALVIARRGAWDNEEWRSALQGYSWAFRGNALRVAGDLVKAGEAFVEARQLWVIGAKVGGELLSEWRIDSLEASLRREEKRFTEAVELLAKAESKVRDDPRAMASLLLKEGVLYEQMENFEAALTSLKKATPHVKASDDPRLLWVLYFESSKAHYSLNQYAQAVPLLEAARRLAERLGNEMDLIRVSWLTARIAAGKGLIGEAIAGLEQVRRDLTARDIPYDAALSSLELAILYLEKGRSREVKTLAREMAPIFRVQGIAREALASLSIFLEAAHREAATLELVRQVIADVVAFQKGNSHLAEDHGA